jgi:uncharacterized protein (TIGR03086 family)
MTTVETAKTEPDHLALLTRAAAGFGEQLLLLTDDEWEFLTPCSDWNVQAVVAHVVVGDAQVPPILAGEIVPLELDASPTVLGPNAIATWRGTALAMLRAFAEPGVLQQRYQHPIGRVTGKRILGFRLTDALVHAWDISRACGRDLSLDDDLAEYCLDFWFPLASGLVESGHFKAAMMPTESASPGERLLALLGRQI